MRQLSGPVYGNTPLIANGGIVYIGDSFGMFQAVRFSFGIAAGTPLWSRNFNPISSSAAMSIDGSTVYFGTEGGQQGSAVLHARLASNGNAAWQFNRGALAITSVVVGLDSTIYISAKGTGRGDVYAVTSRGGERWAFRTASQDSEPSAVALSPSGDAVYVADAAAFKVYAINTANGQQVWAYTTAGTVFWYCTS